MDNRGFDGSPEDFKDKNIVLNQIKQDDSKQIKHTYEEAISLLGIGKFQKLHLLVCGIGALAFISETLGVSVIMPSAKCDLHFSLYEQGILASVGFLGVVLSSHAMGFLADTCGRRKTLIYSLILSSICSLVSIFSTTVWMLIIMRFFVGVFMNGCQSSVFSYMGEFHNNNSKPKYVTLLSTFFTLGAFYFPAMAIGILPLEIDTFIGSIKFSSWRLCMLFSSLPTFIVCIVIPFFPESPKFLLIQGKHDEAIAVLRKVYKFNTGNEEISYPVQFLVSNEESSSSLSKVKTLSEAAHIIWIQTKPLFSKKHRWMTMNLGFQQFTTFFVSHGSLMWTPGMFKAIIDYSSSSLTLCEAVNQQKLDASKLNETEFGQEFECLPSQRVDIFVLEMLALMGLCFTVGYIIFAFIVNYVGKRRLLLIWMIICGPCIPALIWTRPLALNIILLFLYIGYGNCNALITAITVNYFPTNINGMAMCLIMMIGRLGAFLGSNIIGIVLNQNCPYSLVMLSVMICFALGLWNFLPKDKEQKNLEET